MKIRTFAILAISLFAISSAVAQDIFVPNDDEIYKEVSAPASKYYYPNLMMRYEVGDTTLTTDEYRRLYYGYIWQDSYKPLEPIAAEHQVLMLLEQHRDMVFDTVTLRRLLGYTQEVMAADPFSLNNINMMTFAYQQLGDEQNAKKSAYRFAKVLETIQTSGTGVKDKSPWHVLRQDHVSDVLAVMGLVAKKRTYITVRVEYLELIEEYNHNKGLFFDFGRAYRKPPENAATEKRNSGLEFNGIKLK